MDIENINYNFLEKQQYINSLNALNDSLKLILDEFAKLYVITNMHPSNQEYQQLFENSKANISQIQAKIFTTSNDIQSNTNKLNELLLKLDALIKVERKKNKILKKKLGIVEHKNNAASEMIYNYKEIYNSNYLRNWGLILSTFLCIYTISSVYKKQGV